MKISGSGAQAVTVTVGTTAPTAGAAMPFIGFPPLARPLMWSLLSIGFVGLLVSRRKRLPVLAAPVMALALLTCVSCGGSGSSQNKGAGTPPGTYTATVTATSGSLRHNVAFTVVVQ